MQYNKSIQGMRDELQRKEEFRLAAGEKCMAINEQR